MQWHGIMGALLQASSSKLGRPPYGSADCVIWRANADLHAGTIAAAAVDDKALGTLACSVVAVCRGLHLVIGGC